MARTLSVTITLRHPRGRINMRLGAFKAINLTLDHALKKIALIRPGALGHPQHDEAPRKNPMIVQEFGRDTPRPFAHFSPTCKIPEHDQSLL